MSILLVKFVTITSQCRVKTVHLKNCINESATKKVMYLNTLNSWQCVYTSDTLDEGWHIELVCTFLIGHLPKCTLKLQR